jgi:hypothetical protein
MKNAFDVKVESDEGPPHAAASVREWTDRLQLELGERREAR